MWVKNLTKNKLTARTYESVDDRRSKCLMFFFLNKEKQRIIECSNCRVRILAHEACAEDLLVPSRECFTLYCDEKRLFA